MRAMSPIERKRAGYAFAKELEETLFTKALAFAPSACGISAPISVSSPRYLNLRIERVIFNDPATIVYWEDGTKTVVKCQPGDTFSKETGLAVAFMKKALGNKGSFNDVFRKWVYDDEEH